jgi:hypothetical protein
MFGIRSGIDQWAAEPLSKQQQHWASTHLDGQRHVGNDPVLQPHGLDLDGERMPVPHARPLLKVVAVDGLQRLHLLRLREQRVLVPHLMCVCRVVRRAPARRLANYVSTPRVCSAPTHALIGHGRPWASEAESEAAHRSHHLDGMQGIDPAVCICVCGGGGGGVWDGDWKMASKVVVGESESCSAATSRGLKFVGEGW